MQRLRNWGAAGRPAGCPAAPDSSSFFFCFLVSWTLQIDLNSKRCYFSMLCSSRNRFASLPFFRSQICRRPAHHGWHIPCRQVSACTVTFRGPGAGICRRQLRWSLEFPFWAKKAPKTDNPECPRASRSRSCFSFNHSNYCAVGTYCFLQRHFWDAYLTCSRFL